MAPEAPSTNRSPDVEPVVAVLDDGACRTIIAALERPMTVSEIAEAAELPLSTTYKKLDTLAEAELVREIDRYDAGRHRTARYVTDFDEIAIDLASDRTFRVRITRSVEQVADVWSELSVRS
ncbi:helix-turn-helix domain-containing protein [Halobacteria archaeon AArc-dxtr1]|nr:helix-turn-helix domain-containing protein [Halobacteria archaeon AArc-dxtr1]